jgi:hypothetical protein
MAPGDRGGQYHAAVTALGASPPGGKLRPRNPVGLLQNVRCLQDVGRMQNVRRESNDRQPHDAPRAPSNTAMPVFPLLGSCRMAAAQQHLRPQAEARQFRLHARQFGG